MVVCIQYLWMIISAISHVIQAGSKHLERYSTENYKSEGTN